MMHGQEKSDFGVVAEKPANNGGEPSAERAEPRPETKGNAGQQSTHRAQDRARVTQALDRVRQASPSTTRGRSHMRESRPCGSERGAPSNGRPYRESAGKPLFGDMEHNGTGREQLEVVRLDPWDLAEGLQRAIAGTRLIIGSAQSRR